METITDDPLFKYDNHAAHYETHRKFILSPEFKEVPQEYAVILIYHADTHKNEIEQVQPDIRDYVQIDKLLVANVLTASERAQVLDKYLGIQAGDEDTLGLPSADVVVKSKEKMINTEIKEAGKAKQMNIDLIKHQISEANKAKQNKSPNK